MRFHSDDYINFLQRITPETMGDAGKLLHRCKLASTGTTTTDLLHLAP